MQSIEGCHHDRHTIWFFIGASFNRGRFKLAKKSASSDFDMAEAVRECFEANPKVTSAEAIEAITAKYPKVKINKAAIRWLFTRSGRSSESVAESVEGELP